MGGQSPDLIGSKEANPDITGCFECAHFTGDGWRRQQSKSFHFRRFLEPFDIRPKRSSRVDCHIICAKNTAGHILYNIGTSACGFDTDRRFDGIRDVDFTKIDRAAGDNINRWCRWPINKIDCNWPVGFQGVSIKVLDSFNRGHQLVVRLRTQPPAAGLPVIYRLIGSVSLRGFIFDTVGNIISLIVCTSIRIISRIKNNDCLGFEQGLFVGKREGSPLITLIPCQVVVNPIYKTAGQVEFILLVVLDLGLGLLLALYPEILATIHRGVIEFSTAPD